MFIKDVVIDGFKSYGQKTEIGEFDPVFNAITGLNGTGKSNILDSICFVLGLSNMSLARVSNLRELIFKNGQTGVSKATVTVTFNNKEKSQSPAGYEHYDEIVVRREVNLNSRTKYYINGFSVANNQVADLFHSVQLNINNPHFLIMQGRITKVLNMKPNEILAMVEEATGVSMYELKKKHTQTLIEKKDAAIRDIDILVDQTIKPKLEQLNKEQSSLLEYKKATAELEHLNKKHIAYQYIQNEKFCQQSANLKKETETKISTFKSNIEKANESVEQLIENISELEKRKDAESGGIMAKLEKDLRDYQIKEITIKEDIENDKDCLKEEQRNLEQLEKLVNDDRKTHSSKQKELENIKQTYDGLVEVCNNDETAFIKAQKDFEAISAGLSRAAEGEAADTLANQLIHSKNELAKVETESTILEMKIKQYKEDLKKSERESNKESGNYTSLVKEIEAKEKELNSLQNQCSNFDENKQANLQNERNQLRNEIEDLRETTRNLEYRYPQTQFQYQKPTQDFDHSRVYGVVCNLLKLKDHNAFLALEAAVGSKLFNVVVDNEETAKLIFERSQLKRRVTLLPLNKIQGRDVDKVALRNAEALVGKENVCSALSLVDYPSHLHPVMKFVFNDVLVCSNMDIAKRVAFAENVMKRTVTYDGEIFDPSGTLFGGSRSRNGSVLEEAQKIRENNEKVKKLEVRLNKIENELNLLKNDFDKYNKYKQKVELLIHEINLIKERLQQTNQHRIIEEINKLKMDIKDSEQLILTNKESKQKLSKKISELELKLKDSKSIRERELKEAENNMIKCKQNAEKSKKNLSNKKYTFESLELEIIELNKLIEANMELIEQKNILIKDIEEKICKTNSSLKDLTENINDQQTQLNEKKKELKAKNDEINKLNKEKEKLNKRISDDKLEIKKLEHELDEIQKNCQDSNKSIKILLQKYSWINEEKKFFYDQNGCFSLNNETPENLVSRIEKLKQTINKLSKTVNLRANIMLTDREKEAEDLVKRRKIIEHDRKSLIKYMKEVDQKKLDALQNAWEKINADFGSIFSTILPGTNAKLDVCEGKTVLDGLEVKVAFGGIWKQSLTELSGGQRSLVALSLILSLLLFNPAPIYILDEVDAALDQHHTTNIGTMIKKHFTKSQFIIVSLKEDMFNNANVLFKTKFDGGNSTVKRFTKSGV